MEKRSSLFPRNLLQKTPRIVLKTEQEARERVFVHIPYTKIRIYISWRKESEKNPYLSAYTSREEKLDRGIWKD
jgi:hypothetical protein